MKMKFTKWSMAIALFAMTLLLPLEVTAKKLYLDAGGSSKWDQGGAWFSAWVWGSSKADAWYRATKGDVYYEIEVPDDATGMKWVRFSKVSTQESWTKAEGDVNGYWNQTGDLTIGADNLLTIKGWGTSLGTDYAWSTYTPPTPEPDPDQPVDPEDPDTPVDPEDPDQPVDPEDPDQPVDPEDPDTPVEPEDPDTPVVPDPEEPAGITFTVQVPEGTIECYVAGSPSWSFVQMEKVEGEENLFTVTTTELDGTAWKYSSGASWSYVEKDAQGNEITDRKTAGNPDVVAKWALLYEPDAEPIEPYYAIRGLVSWDMADDIKLTANAEGTEYAITGLDIEADKEFKVIYVDENVNITWYGVSALEANHEITQTGTDNIILAAGKYDIYFKVDSKTIWIDLTSVDDPDQPVDPEDPDQPVDPEDPDQPVDPEDPDQPVDPEDPDQPVDPEDPDQPVDPEDPDTPVVPDPEEPAAITFTVQVPEGTIECYITGADLWNTGEFLQMEKVEGEENLFTITTTALKGTEWKYASGPSWDYVEKDAQGGEVANRTEAGNPDVVASWLAVYTPAVDPEDPDQPVDPEDPDTPVDPEDPDQPVDPEDPDTPVVPDPEEPEEPAGITFTVQVPEGTIECYITGADLWNTGEFLQMEKVEGEENLFTITTTALKGTAWKYCSGPSWDYVEKDAQGNEITDRTEAGNPDVVASWLAVYTPAVDPEDPDQPVDPEDPDTPVDPEDPDTPVDPEPEMLTLYYVNNQGWDEVAAYAWDATPIAEWPGELATKTDLTAKGYDVYSYTFDSSKAVNIIFNNNNNGSKTSDLTFDPSKPYFYIDQWYASLEEIEELVSVEEVAAFAIYATNGTIYADCEFAIYNLIGIDVTAQNGSLNGKYIVKTEKGSKLISVW